MRRDSAGKAFWRRRDLHGYDPSRTARKGEEAGGRIPGCFSSLGSRGNQPEPFEPWEGRYRWSGHNGVCGEGSERGQNTWQMGECGDS